MTTRLTLRALAAVLAVVASAALVLEGASLPHSHASNAPALYNHDHDRTSCATFGAAPIPAAAPDVPRVPAASGVIVSAVAKPPLSARGLADSRAPPLA
jgi:hypothetical protein